ncbi:unnamed protein product [Timema podura]|uniref:Uncharacterized protein n=1 Tax=Timema podura TaxID=61482 RepID=A0ABN7NWB1_TIMPD|nr:unnamed protein product [Timema podura]
MSFTMKRRTKITLYIAATGQKGVWSIILSSAQFFEPTYHLFLRQPDRLIPTSWLEEISYKDFGAKAEVLSSQVADVVLFQKLKFEEKKTHFECNYWIAEYIGLTTGTLKQQMNGHRLDTNHDDPDKPVAHHAQTHNSDFDSCYSTGVLTPTTTTLTNQ